VCPSPAASVQRAVGSGHPAAAVGSCEGRGHSALGGSEEASILLRHFKWYVLMEALALSCHLSPAAWSHGRVLPALTPVPLLSPPVPLLSPPVPLLSPPVPLLSPRFLSSHPGSSPLTPGSSPLTPGSSPLTPGSSPLTPGSSPLTTVPLLSPPVPSPLTPGSLSSHPRFLSSHPRFPLLSPPVPLLSPPVPLLSPPVPLLSPPGSSPLIPGSSPLTPVPLLSCAQEREPGERRSGSTTRSVCAQAVGLLGLQEKGSDKGKDGRGRRTPVPSAHSSLLKTGLPGPTEVRPASPAPRQSSAESGSCAQEVLCCVPCTFL